MYKKYIDYYKHNPEGYWFKRKLFGFGWVPVTWQGWLTVGVWGCLVALLTITLDEQASFGAVMLTFVVPILFLTILLILVCYKKGETPRWQWGLDDKEK